MRILMFFILVSCLSGCGTLVTYMQECLSPECMESNQSKSKIEYYRATRNFDLELWSRLPEIIEEKPWYVGVFATGFASIDTVLTVTIDTILLPFQFSINLFIDEEKIEKADSENNKT